MDNSPQDDESPHDYDEIPSRDPGTDLNTNPQTIREYQTRLQDLNRENFDLKLRIFFLEQNGPNTKNNSSIQNQSSPRFPSTYGFYDEQDPFQTRQTGYERDLRHSSLSPIRRQPDSSNDDELSPAVRNRYGRDRPENDKTHRSYRHSGESGEYTPTINIDPITQTFATTSTPIDSNQGTLMPTSTYNLQLNDRERRVQDENNALKKENTALRSRVNENFDELKRVKGQYETAVRDNEEQQVKAERVIKRMKADYEARLVDVEEEKRQKLSQYESYRHEPLLARIRFTYPLQEQTNSNVNIEEYLRKIDEQERLIKQLNDRLDAANAYQEKPYTPLFPSSPNDENSRRLNEYAETIDQLRGECDELRRSEKHLRRQVDELNRLFEPANGHLPPTSRPSIVDDAEPVDDPQSAIAHTSIKLQKDAENVSGVTNRIHQMIREREDNQNKLKDRDAQLRQYEARERELENRILQKFESQIEGLQHEIKHLEQETRDRDRRIAELEDDIKSQVTHHDPGMESRHSREKQDYEQRIHVANGHIDDLRQEIDREHQEYDSLRKDYEKMKDTLDSSNIESLEDTIQQQGKQIEEDHAQLQALEKTFQQQRAYLEREKDYEKQKAEQNQNELDSYKKRYADLQSQYEQLRPLLDDQQNKYEKQIRSYQAELAQVEQERDDLNDELQLLKHEKETWTTKGPENHPKFVELSRKNDDLEEQVSRYKVRVHDSEDENNRNQRELSTLQGDYQTTNQHYEDLKDAHTKAQDELTSLANEKDQIQSDNQALNQENTKLKHDIEDLEVRIRFEIQQEQENENRLNEQKDAEIENALREKEAVEFELERANNERKKFENQLRDVEDELQKANETIDNYVQDLDRLRADLNRAKENNEQIERDVSQAYADKLRDQNDRIQELEQQLKSNGNRPNSVYYDEQISPSHEAPTNYYEQTSFDENDRVVRRPNIPDQRALVSQLENKLRERDDVIQSLRNSRATGEGEPTDIELKFQIQIQQLEKDLESKDRIIEKYTETAQAQEQYIEKLLDNLQQGDSSPTGVVQTLREELDNRNRRIDQILNDKNLEIDQRDRQIGVLELNIKDRDHRLAETVERLGEAEQKIDEQQLEIDDIIREKNRLTIVPEDRETYLTQIQNLEKALEMEKRMSTATPSEQRDHYQNVIDDLKRQIHRRDDSIQNLQRTLRDSDEQLRDTRKAQHKMASDFNRTNVHADQLVSDVENRDQAIASLREKLAEKDQEIDKLHENNLTKEQKLNDLYSKLIQIDPNIKPTPLSSERAPSNVQMKIELQRKEQEINDLKQRLEQALADPSSSSTTTVPQETKYRQRPSYDHLNREELLYELEMALQHNQELNDQLQAKNPTTGVKEIHRRLAEVRDELARQKYVNQVLWRKLDALIDIHGSNTRNELAIELANYQDELAKLKSQHNHTSLGRKDSGISSVATDPAEQQRQIRDKDDQIRNLNNQLREKDEQIQQIINDLKNSKKAYEDLQQQNRNDYDRIRRDLTDELRATQNELQEARVQLDSLKTSRPKYEQAEDQNQRLRAEIKHLQNEIETNKPLLEHYKKQIDILEKRTPSVQDADSSDMIIRSSELSQLLEEMRLLRRDLERSLQKQNELQAKLDENIRQSQSPREFTFTGRGVSYPDLRVTDGSGFLGPETVSLSSNLNGKYSKPLASSSTELDHIEFPSLSTRETERTVTIKTYIVGELRLHNELRQLVENIKFDLKAIAQEWKEKLRSRTNSSITDAFIRSLDERFIALDERLTHALDLIETYWKADLPEKNRDDEHVFIDQRLYDENKHLLAAQRKYIRDTQVLREKYTEQSKHLDQLLAQLTKANRKKADTGDYLALLLRPTLDVLQKARSNIENHLKETNPNNIPPGSAQSRRRHRSNRQE